MFFLNRGYRRTINEDIEHISGSVLLPSGNVSEKLLRMPAEFKRILIGPQLYLATLWPDECKKTCSRLATYPWFGIRGLPDFDSAEAGLRSWEQTIRGDIERLWPSSAPRGDAINAAVFFGDRFSTTDACKLRHPAEPINHRARGRSADTGPMA